MHARSNRSKDARKYILNEQIDLVREAEQKDNAWPSACQYSPRPRTLPSIICDHSTDIPSFSEEF
ncbi:hypothetical protein PsorP6_003989 [Peronosclerospora sorghi]|uniref:Uncharacterized protein n=1 Tax=Peronosclerospora sorghi TaxID=230839 RepID=A0ACC0VIG7_9STRA|nr:hypothetical protein PsorP6_003989 [Peronosclerospora sorghi]